MRITRPLVPVRPSPLVAVLLAVSAVSWLGYGLVLAEALAGGVSAAALAGIGLLAPGDVFVTWLTLYHYRRQIARARR